MEKGLAQKLKRMKADLCAYAERHLGLRGATGQEGPTAGEREKGAAAGEREAGPCSR
jgi:hypothetical protein